MIREATLKDLKSICAIGFEEANKFNVRPDKDKIRHLATSAISTKSNFCWVTYEGDSVTGVIVAIGHQGLWFERRHLSILLLATTTVGDGRKLLKELLSWVSGRRAIKVVTTDFVVPPRLSKLLNRVGIPAQNTTHTLFT